MYYPCSQRAQRRKVVLSTSFTGRKERKQEQGERYKRKMSAASREIHLSYPAIWREPRSPAEVLLSVEHEEGESVD